MSHARLFISLSAGPASALVCHFAWSRATTEESSTFWHRLRGADWFYTNFITTNCDTKAASYLNGFVPGSPYIPASGCASPNAGLAKCGACDGGVTFRQSVMGNYIGGLNGEMDGAGPNCGDLMKGTCGYVNGAPNDPPTYGWGCINQVFATNGDGLIIACGQPLAIVNQRTGQ